MSNAENPRPVIMWILTPLMLISTYLVYLNFSGRWSPMAILGQSIFILMSIGMIAATISPKRGWWGLRLVTFFIFLAYFGYLWSEFILKNGKVVLTETSGTSPFLSLLGFLAFGIPCLIYSLWGSVIGRLGYENHPAITGWDVSVYYLFQMCRWLFIILSALSVVIIIYRHYF